MFTPRHRRSEHLFTIRGLRRRSGEHTFTRRFALCVAGLGIFAGACAAPGPTPNNAGAGSPAVAGQQVVAAGLAAPSAAGPSQAGQGLVGGGGFAEGSAILWGTDAELARELDGMAAAGARWLRVDIDWGVVERVRGSFNWSVPDRVINGARARGLSVLGMTGYTPAWARPAGTTDKHSPSNPADFATFARAAASHYRGVVSAYEIWNEQNSYNFWQPQPNPAAYATLLKLAYSAIKAVDPGATVMTGGFSPAPDSADGNFIAPVTFLQGVYAAGSRGSFDAVAHHPSNYPFMPGTQEQIYNYNAFGGVTPVLRNVMVQNGDGAKRIWATEMGSPVPFNIRGIQTTPQYLASYITEAYQMWDDWAWTGPLFWYSYRDAFVNAGDVEANFGVVTRNFTPKEPALSAIRTAMLNA